MTASCPVQTDFRMSLHRYQNEIAQQIIIRNTASFKKSCNEGQAAGCSRCKTFPTKMELFDHGNVPAICQSSALPDTPFFCLIDRVAVKSAGSNPAKTGPGRGVQHNTNFPYKTLVTLKNSIPSQLYSSTSCKCLPNWPDSPQSDASQAGEVLCKLWLVRISARSKVHCCRSQKPACVKRSQNTLPFQSRVVPV